MNAELLNCWVVHYCSCRLHYNRRNCFTYFADSVMNFQTFIQVCLSVTLPHPVA